jgi:lipoprotein-anchoring transpeptidase ErfK/SrfK
VPEKGEEDAPPATVPSDPEKAKRADSLFSEGMRDIQSGALLAARAHLSDAVELGLDQQRMLDARAALARIGTQTIFSGVIVDGDPFVSRVVIQPGETLNKIAKRFDITDDFLASINGIQDKNRIRAGQSLKVVQGPFHARIDKKSYRMDVYLQNTFVRHYSVGLGADDSTPSGVWKVGTKLVNPTYYPPRGGQIVAADDPQNPLGERWIEMIGVAGGAVGQLRYGIHGTIDPNSIGRSESLGCIRLHNADVEEVYNLLIPEKSTITVE